MKFIEQAKFTIVITLFYMINPLDLMGGTSTTKSAPQTQPALRIRVATYNILCGRYIKDVVKNIKHIRPDIICLQEAPLNSRRGVRKIARVLGMDYLFYGYHKKGGVGLAILATGRIEPVRYFPEKTGRSFALAGKVEIGGRKILVVSIHLKSLPRPIIKGLLTSMDAHKKQVKRILELVTKDYPNIPVIVAGDTNTLPFTPEYIMLTNRLKDCCIVTKTSHKPSIFIGKTGYRIDHIFIRGDWKILKCDVSPLAGSDHRLVWADLKLEVEKSQTVKPKN